MSGNLVTRIGRLEAVASATTKTFPKVVRLVTTDADEAAAYRAAEEMGLDVSPDSDDILVIRLIALSPRKLKEQSPQLEA